MQIAYCHHFSMKNGVFKPQAKKYAFTIPQKLENKIDRGMICGAKNSHGLTLVFVAKVVEVDENKLSKVPTGSVKYIKKNFGNNT